MKTIKVIVILFLFLVAFPALAGWAVMSLWNNIIPAVCGFSTITFWQSVGLFVMGQILTGGILLAMFFIGGGLHAFRHHHGDWKNRWHNMTSEQRREFIEQRRAESFGFHNRQNKRRDVSE